MSLKSKLKIENFGMFAASIFYTLAGLLCFTVLIIVDFRLVHIGIMGILSFITAYGLFERRSWSLWIAVALFFIGTTFSAYTLYYTLGKDLFLNISAVAYVICTWVFTVYVTAKRRTLEG